MNSFRKPVSDQLIKSIHKLEDNNDLEDYMLRVCDSYGVLKKVFRNFFEKLELMQDGGVKDH